jgi:DNA-binding CsgD family transcriptional regulator
MNDPRSSTDPDLIAALKAWDNASPFRDKVFDDAMRIRTALRDTPSHQAYGWAALTCGRIAAHRQHVDLAEVLLTEALGRFYFVGDTYGENMAISHLALPHIFRRNLDRALELALSPLSSKISFSDEDKFLLHNVATQCYWAREESHPAILHLIKAYDLVKDTVDFNRKSAVLGNIGVVLQTLGEWDLALSASTEAWALQLENCRDRRELQLSHLSNLVLVTCQLENYGAAICHAELLFDYLKPGTYPATWGMFENIADAFSFDSQIDKAQYCLDRAGILKQGIVTPFSKAATQVSEAILLEAKQDYRAAIALAKEILGQPVTTVMHSTHRFAARVLSRCSAALGHNAESAKWKKFAAEAGRDRLLSNILSNQLRASLKVEQPAEPLTDQELTCLSLSAHGQTSADIALKLGIKPRTVNFHFTKILRKLNAMNRQEAIAKASEANLLRRP